MILGLFVILLILFVVLPLVGMALWAIITTLVVGLIIGGLARLVIPGRQPLSLLATAVAGLIGAIIGGFIGDHVLDVGGFGTTLLEIGVAALVVAALSAPSRGFTRLR